LVCGVAVAQNDQVKGVINVFKEKSWAQRGIFTGPGCWDSACRFSVNLKGGPALPPNEFVKWRQPRLWVSLDGSFWYGGETSLNGVPNPKTKQTNSRIGTAAAVPISKHQSLKISYNNGAYINYGGNYQNISLTWQYSWVG
jgi:hypothetical protein